MAVTVTNTTIAALDADQAFTANAATVDTIDGTEVFTVTPTKSAGKVAIFIKVGPTNGAVAYSIAAGELWAAGSAKTGSIAQNGTEVIQLDTAKYKKANGTIAITLTPASGKKLLTDHAAAMYVLELI